MTGRQPLDEIDLKILSELQRDGRIRNNELAVRVGLSEPPCRRRVSSGIERLSAACGGGGACRSSTDIGRRADRQAPLPAVHDARSRHRSNPPKYSGQRTVGIAATARWHAVLSGD